MNWHIYIFILLFQLISCIQFNYCLDISHKDLELANITCDGKSNCLSNTSNLYTDLDWRDRNCFCDSLCKKYGDCCLDSPYYNLIEQRRSLSTWSCINLKHFGGIYMKSSCPPNWEDTLIINMCEDNNNIDPLLNLPVTSLTTNYTYKNIYCSICHSDYNIEVWKPRLECPSLSHKYNISSNNLFLNLKYLIDKKSWGILFDNKFHSCNIYPVMSESIKYIIRRCINNVISTCNKHWNNNDVRNRCEAYTSIVYDFTQAYRNPHCALCNNLKVQYLQCNKATLRSIFHSDFDPTSFAILFDLSGKGSVGSIKKNCEIHQIFDPFYQKCRNIYLEATYIKKYKDDNEYLINNIPNNIKINITTIDINHEVFNDQTNNNYNNISNNNIHEYNEEIYQEYKCPKILLNKNEYIIMDDILYIPKYHKTFNSNQYKLINNSVEICLYNIEINSIYYKNKFTPTMGYLTFIGLGLSIVFILCHLIAFVLVSELRNLSGKNLASFCLSLLCGYICFILNGQLVKGLSCFIIAILMQYFFLCSFFWELIISFDIWRTLRLATAELRISNGKQLRKFTVYSIICWVLPGVISMITVIIDITPSNNFINNNYKPNFGKNNYCWFGNKNGLLIFFGMPLLIIMILNLLFFISCSYMIYSTSSLTRYTITVNTHRDYRLYVKLFLLMGLTWSIGLFAGYIDNVYLWYIFILLNTFQGVFIFIVFTCTNKYIKNIICRKNKLSNHIPSNHNHHYNNKNNVETFSSSTEISNRTDSTKQLDNRDQLI